MTSTPLWQSIATALREDLTQGRYQTGDKLPTEAELSARFGVNRHTVRHAIGALVDEGLMHSRRGAGVFVTSVTTEYPIGRRVRFHQNLEAAGKVPGRQILGIEWRKATGPEAAALGLQPGDPVYCAEGLSFANAEPIAVFRSVFPGWLSSQFPAHLQTAQSVTTALQAAGIADYTRASTKLTARAATAVQAGHLRLREGAPLLQSEAINHTPDGRPVEYGLTWFAGDKVTLNIPGDTDASSHL